MRLFSITALLIFAFSAHSVRAKSTQGLPTLGDSSSSISSLDYEKKLGAAFIRSLRRQVQVYDDPIVMAYLASLVYKLAPNSSVIDKDFQFIILDSQELNAFAVPGSIIGINAGLFTQSENEQQFASVLAHELAHLGQRHYARQQERQKLSTPLTIAGMMASIVLAVTTGSDAGLAAMATTQAVAGQKQLAFSRQNEQEADRIGIVTLAKSGFDPREMPKMFEQMYRDSELQGNNPPEYLSTHPVTESRITDSRNRAEQYPKNRVFSDSLEFDIAKVRVIRHFMESDTRSEKFFRAILASAKPEESEPARYGLAISISKSHPEQAIKLLDSLLKIHPNYIAYVASKSKALLNLNRTEEAADLLSQQLNLSPENIVLSESDLAVLLKQEKLTEAGLLIHTLTQIEKGNPEVWFKRAEISGRLGDIVDVHISRAEHFFLTGKTKKAIEQLQLALRKSAGNDQKTARIQTRLDELISEKENKYF